MKDKEILEKVLQEVLYSINPPRQIRNEDVQKAIHKAISLARKSEREEVVKLIDKLCLECPIKDDKECWCKPLEELKQKLTQSGGQAKGEESK